MKAPSPASAAPSLRSRSLMTVGRKQTVVTGGAGCVGRNFIAALNERDEDNILVVDRLGTGDRWKNLVGLRFDDLVTTDDFRARVRENGLPPTMTVVHLAATTTGDEPDTDALVDQNYRYARELCEACLKSGARFIYASSAATYGAGELGFFDNEQTLPNLQPVDAYGFSQHIFDLWAHRSGALARIAGLKLFHVYGAPARPGAGSPSLVHDMLRQVVATGEVALTDRPEGEGEQLDYIHVRDVVAMLLHFFDRPDAAGLFNCGTGRARSASDVARAAFAAIGREPRMTYVDTPAGPRHPAPRFAQADMTKARAAGFDHPFLTLEAGVQDCMRELAESRA